MALTAFGKELKTTIYTSFSRMAELVRSVDSPEEALTVMAIANEVWPLDEKRMASDLNLPLEVVHGYFLGMNVAPGHAEAILQWVADELSAIALRAKSRLEGRENAMFRKNVEEFLSVCEIPKYEWQGILERVDAAIAAFGDGSGRFSGENFVELFGNKSYARRFAALCEAGVLNK